MVLICVEWMYEVVLNQGWQLMIIEKVFLLVGTKTSGRLIQRHKMKKWNYIFFDTFTYDKWKPAQTFHFLCLKWGLSCCNLTLYLVCTSVYTKYLLVLIQFLCMLLLLSVLFTQPLLILIHLLYVRNISVNMIWKSVVI